MPRRYLVEIYKASKRRVFSPGIFLVKIRPGRRHRSIVSAYPHHQEHPENLSTSGSIPHKQACALQITFHNQVRGLIRQGHPPSIHLLECHQNIRAPCCRLLITRRSILQRSKASTPVDGLLLDWLPPLLDFLHLERPPVGRENSHHTLSQPRTRPLSSSHLHHRVTTRRTFRAFLRSP